VISENMKRLAGIEPVNEEEINEFVTPQFTQMVKNAVDILKKKYHKAFKIKVSNAGIAVFGDAGVFQLATNGTEVSIRKPRDKAEVTINAHAANADILASKIESL
jgi:hypothetical protein